jgi:hypothetical protein
MISENLAGLGWPALIVCLAVGLFLALLSPYRAFLFATFISLAFGNAILGSTRTETLGSYFNLYDACLVISFFALFLDRKPAMRLPGPVIALLGVLIMGFVNSWVLGGATYTLLRSFRWAIIIPMQIFLAANMVRGGDRVKSLLMTLIAAAIFAELQHVMSVAIGMGSVGGSIELLRSFEFYKAGSTIWLTAGFFLIRDHIPKKLLQVSIGVLFFLCNLSTATRSLFLGMAAGGLVFYFWYLKGENAYRWLRLKGLLYSVIFGLLIAIVVGFGAFASMLESRLVNTVEKKAETETREKAFEVETREWLKGNVLIGRGLDFYQTYRRKAKGSAGEGIAFGHLGYISYLSQLGIIGLLVYGFYFPGVCLLRSRRLFMEDNLTPAIIHLALLTGALFLVYPITFLFSGSFLQDIYLAGILPGAIWANTIPQRQNHEERATVESGNLPTEFTTRDFHRQILDGLKESTYYSAH